MSFLNKLSNVLGGGPAAQQQQQPAAGQMGAQQGQWGQGQTGTQGQWQGQQGQQAQNLQSVELDLTNYQILSPQALGTTDVSSFRPYYAVIVNGNESARQTIPAMSLSDLGVSNISQPINFRSKLIFTCDPTRDSVILEAWGGASGMGARDNLLAKTAPLQLSQLCANQTTPQFNQSVQFFLAQQQGQAGGMQQPFATATAYFRLLPSGHADIQQQQGMGQQQPMATGGYGGGYGQQDPTKNVGAGGYGGQQMGASGATGYGGQQQFGQTGMTGSAGYGQQQFGSGY